MELGDTLKIHTAKTGETNGFIVDKKSVRVKATNIFGQYFNAPITVYHVYSNEHNSTYVCRNGNVLKFNDYRMILIETENSFAKKQ